jgi:gliding motility-associated-like protein
MTVIFPGAYSIKIKVSIMLNYYLKHIFFLVAVTAMVVSSPVAAQVTVGSITPVLVGSTGNFSIAGGMMISASTGEPMVSTLSNGNFILTQGFQQPSGNSTLTLNASIIYTNASCAGSNDGFANVTPMGGVGPYSFVWSSNLNDSITNNTIDSLSPGTYNVTVIDAGGLTINQTFSILDGTGICGLIVYSGLTPNNDGHNDLWIIDFIDLYQPNTVLIYNRWGSLVWKGNNYNNRDVVWNGNDQNGKALTDGTYFYVIEVKGGHMESWVELSH